jgi:hypothetical protein
MMSHLISPRNLLPHFVAAFLLFAVAAGCGKAGQLKQVIEGVQELQPKAEERNREIEGLAQPEHASQ